MSDLSSATSPPASGLLARWRAIPLANRVVGLVLVLLMIGAVVHQQVPRLANWFIEDSAISFAYARNLAEGEGLVPWRGGERVEGYSNPTWVFLLGFLYLFGANPFDAAKVLGSIFGAVTVPLCFLIAKEALPRRSVLVALIAALAFAVNSQAAIWAASGLENSLFNVLLAAALWRTLVEQRRGGWPFGAFFYFLLAITRPEGIMYAAMGGFWYLVWTASDKKGLLPTAKWLLTFWAPFVVYHLWRYSYFAWEFPNTYYAKDRNHNMQNWERFRGWKQLRGWSHEVAAGYFFPLFFLGVTTLRRWRGFLAVLLLAVAGIWIVYPGTETLSALSWWPELPAPDWWSKSKPWVVLVTALLVPLFSFGSHPGWRARMLCWWTMCATVFFAVWSSGDWMKGYRWFSLLAVPLCVLFAVGIAEVGSFVQRLFTGQDARWSVPGVLVAMILAPLVVPVNVVYTEFWSKKRETGPFVIKRRVEYMTSIAERLWMDEPIVTWDVDQGAHLYWSGFQMMDMAGLVDVPVAHHRYEKPFMREHLFAEGKPHFAHVHGGWGNTTRIPTYMEWRRDYVEIPGYGRGKRLHIGNHIRRDLLLTTEWDGPHREVVFDGGVELVGFDIPSAETARARAWWLEVALRTEPREEGEDFRLVMFLSDGEHTQTWELPPGYDWVPPHQWKPEEIFYGRFSPELNKPMVLGTYDIGFVIFGADGSVLSPKRDEEGNFVKLPEGAIVGGVDEEPAYFAAGEVRFPDAFTIVTVEDNATNAREDREKARSLAQEGRCVKAEDFWWQARMHRPKNDKWWSQFGPGIEDELASCWVKRAVDDPTGEVRFMERAHRWNHRNEDYQQLKGPIGDALYAKGLVAREAKDWELAYDLFTQTLRVDPQRSWARRYAEEARDYRLGLDPETKAERRRKAAERREKLEERRARMKDELEPPVKEESKSKSKSKAKAAPQGD